MKARGKKLLAAMLSLAMVLSMFVVPASAVEAKTWTFTGTDFTDTYTSANKNDVQIYDGLKFKQGYAHNNKYLYMEANGTIQVPLDGPATVTVTGDYACDFYFADDTDEIHYVLASGSGNGVGSYTYAAAPDSGYATVNITSQSYILSVEVAPYDPPAAEKTWTFTGDFTTTYTSADKSNPRTYDGLTFTKGYGHNSKYLYMENGGTVSIPMPGPSTVTVVGDPNGYGYYFEAEGADNTHTNSDESVTASHDYADAKAGDTAVIHFTGGNNYMVSFAIEPYTPPTTVAAKEYKFSTKAGAADGTVDYNDPAFTWSGFTHQNADHGPDNGGNTGTLSFRIPDGKKSTLTLTTCCYGNGEGNIEVTGGSLSGTVTDTSENNNGTKGKVFTINNAKGEVTINFKSSVYVHSLTVGAFTDASAEPDPTLELDASSVIVKMGQTSTVNATVEYVTEPDITATSASETVARATVGDGGAITITPVAVGKTTVTVGVTGTDLSKTIKVRVLPAQVGDVTENTTYNFVANGETLADAYYSDGLEWEGFTLEGEGNKSHGPYDGSPNGKLTVHIPEGKYATLTLVTCQYSSSSLEVTVNDSTTPLTGTGSTDKTFTIENATGATVINFSAKVYVHSVAVSAFTTAVAPTLSLDKPKVELKLGETETDTVIATKANTTAAVKIVSNTDATVATAELGGDGKTITITAKKAGTTTVTVGLDGVAGQDKDITVLVKPAGAEVVAPGTHIFGNKSGEGDITAVGDDGHKAITGIEWGNFVKHDNDHGLRGSGSIIVHLPEDKYSTITVITCHHGNGNPVTATGGSDISVSDEAHTEPDGGNGKVYTISNAKGDTTITFGGSGTVYLHALTIGAFTDEPVVPPPTLTLDKDKVTLEMGVTTSAAVTATVENFEGAVKAASRNPAVATAAVNGNTITITAKAVGETYVDVTLDGVAELKRSVRVYVDPEGGYPDIMAEGTIYFDQLRNADFANVDLSRIPGFDAPNFTVGNEHGIAGTGDITIKMAKSGSITVQGCTYSASSMPENLEMTTSSGTVEKKLVSANNGEANTPLFFVTGAGAGDVTLTFSGGTAYIHYIMVEYDFEITDHKYDVWDFSGKAESGENYNNHITAAADYDGHVTGGLFTSNGNLSFGDLTINHQLNDRLYSTEAGLASIANASGDYTGWYCNGAGNKDITRCITIAHVAAGDKIVAYIGGHNGNVTYHFQGVGPASAQDDVKTQSSALTPCVFVAEHTGTYKIWSEGGNKPLYQRIERYRGVEVSGSLTLPAGFDATGYAVKFINQDTEQVTFATLNGTDFSVTLAPGFKYVASLSGAPGWGIIGDSRFVTTTNDEVLTGKADVALEVGAKALYTYSGTISGFADGYDVSNLAITMVPDKAAVANGAEKVELTLTGTDFTAKLDPDNVTYTLEMTGVNDYAIKAPTQVSSTGTDLTGQTITVEAKALQSVSGKFLGLTGDAAVTALSFENVDDGYTYAATVTANGYTANLRAGAYAAVATVAGHTTKTHVVVTEGKDTVKDLLFVSTAAKPAVTWAKDVYVGYADREDSYKTLREAVDAVSRMNVTSEAKRVTIHIAPGTYREQVIIETPYITLMNDTPEEEVLVTWYYGIGYKYYSSNGKYDAELAYDKFAKGIAGNWGATVQVTSAATAFRAEGITFENSFNRYVTKEEIADGVEPAGNEKIDLVRTLGMDVSTNAATERGTAMYVAAGQSEFYNCKFYSSQDTLYTNGKIYFKNCFIEGQTDYIFGDASSKCVFDACTLNWKGYSANSKGGYITALRTNEGEVGYLFRSCVVSGNPELTVTPGYFGRPWGAKAGVFFLNTKLEKANLINPVGWYEMSGNQPENAQYKEFGTTALDGAAVDTSKRISGTVATQAQADAVKVSDYFGGWKPYYYKDEDPVVAFTTDPTITADAELDKLYPGNVLTVNYSLGENNDANDDSVLQWYRVKGENEYLLATTTATVSKSYKLSDSTGGCQIKVVVTPTTISGNKGEAKSFTLEQAVNSRPSSDMVPTGPSGGSGKGETVTNSDGSKTTTKTDRHGNVTVTTKAPDGSQVVAYTSKDGDKSITVTDAKGTVQAKVELPAAIPAPEEKFADVPEGHWAEESINRMAGLGTIQGIGGGNYDMNSPITRGSVATILYRLSNVEVDGSKGAFTDVESGDWYAEAVAWASSTGVVTGYSESIFAPKDSIDRQQLAVMLYRYAKLLRLDTTTEANLKQFQDAADVADWAADAMSWCVGEGILKGNGYGSLNPAGTASRAECATMLDRFIGLL